MNTQTFALDSVAMPECAGARIVCCTPDFGEGWNWLADELTDTPRQWFFFNDKPRNWLEKIVRLPNLSMMRGCWEAVQAVKQHKGNLLVTHDPRVTFWCAVFAALRGVRVDHLASSFNFPQLPGGLKYFSMRWAFSTVQRFTVYSKVERQLYSHYFGIPISRFDMLHWGIAKPEAQPPEPIETGDYVCAIGGNARDYKTLMLAMEQLPDIPLVAVLRPKNLKGLTIPANVTVKVNLPLATTMNILQHSRFMVLPLNNAIVPCGHVTLVAAMLLGKTFVVTESEGVSDYAFNGTNSLTCAPGNPEALATAIRMLWNHPDRCQLFSDNGKGFAETFCSGTEGRTHFQNFLVSKGL